MEQAATNSANVENVEVNIIKENNNQKEKKFPRYR